jgi:hypothetical protein
MPLSSGGAGGSGFCLLLEEFLSFSSNLLLQLEGRNACPKLASELVKPFFAPFFAHFEFLSMCGRAA